MRYTCVNTAEFLYPDITKYESSSDCIKVLSPKGSYACGQILFYEVNGDTLEIKFEGLSPDVYEMVPVFVDKNYGLDETNSSPHIPERKAPYYVYDCVKPIENTLKADENGVCAVYFSLKIPSDAETGFINGKVLAGDIEIPVEIEVSKVTVPEESLLMLQGYNRFAVCEYHHVDKNSAEFDRLDTEYLKMLRRMRQNMLYCPVPKVTKIGENEYDISFDEMEKFIDKARSLGFKGFNFGLGFRRSWKESAIIIYGLESMSFECYCLLAQLLPKLEKFVKDKGLENDFILGVADEPNDANAMEYRALCGLIRKLAPSIRLLDAMSFGPVHGAIDVWIPLNQEYQRHKKEIDTFRHYGDEIWYYDCCGPRGGKTINRFYDYALLATRYHFWASYRYDLKGYLHWAVNCYQPGQDPFKNSCPEHKNADNVCYLPPGDTHIIYPGENAPWMSVRLEAYRMSAEEYELFRALEKIDKAKADEICLSVCREFDDVDYTIASFNNARNKLIRALETYI